MPWRDVSSQPAGSSGASSLFGIVTAVSLIRPPAAVGNDCLWRVSLSGGVAVHVFRRELGFAGGAGPAAVCIGDILLLGSGWRYASAANAAQVLPGKTTPLALVPAGQRMARLCRQGPHDFAAVVV